MQPNGLIIIHKEPGMTSHTVVQRVKRLLAADKAGHTGTLDPLASGVLPVLLGRGVKASEFLLEGDKHYRALLTLGLTTDTEDISGRVLTRTDELPSAEAVLAAAEALRGEIVQIPPMYSAIKVGGVRLMALARQGKDVEREGRTVTVYRLEITPVDRATYCLEVHCSKGTYIRTLCADLGRALGCGGVMSGLCRTEAAGFGLSEAHTLAELEALALPERQALVLPLEETVFRDCPALPVSPFYAHLLHNGAAVVMKKLTAEAYAPGTRLRLYDAAGFFAVGQVLEGEEGPLVKPVKQLR
ncbi:MAG: tRNA pseudouridine(55) synthase TruB [Eubacteriales bacterium]